MGRGSITLLLLFQVGFLENWCKGAAPDLQQASVHLAKSQKANSPEQSPFEKFAIWRDQRSGGINALYCYLRLHGAKVEFKEFHQKHLSALGTNEENVLTLCRLAEEYGVALKPYTLTVDELRRSSMPLVVHMDGETPDTGAFLLLFQIDGNRMYFMNGPSASIHSMMLEDFRRVWSGIALLPLSGRRSEMLLGGLGLVAGLFTSWGYIRVWRQKQSRRSTGL
jgi:hypothetical protein